MKTSTASDYRQQQHTQQRMMRTRTMTAAPTPIATITPRERPVLSSISSKVSSTVSPTSPSARRAGASCATRCSATVRRRELTRARSLRDSGCPAGRMAGSVLSASVPSDRAGRATRPRRSVSSADFGASCAPRTALAATAASSVSVASRAYSDLVMAGNAAGWKRGDRLRAGGSGGQSQEC